MRRRAGFVVLVHRTVESVGRTLVATLGERASAKSYFLLVVWDLIETPSRIATLRIRSGERSIALPICSSVLADLASSITRRSSLNDQPFGILRGILRCEEQSRQAEYDRLTASPL